MDRNSTIETVESVLPSHPDKVADQIAEAILDDILKQDPEARVAIECFGTNGTLLIGGELTTNAYSDMKKIAQDVLKEVGYDTKGILLAVNQQSPEISKLANKGAGDSGMVYGYACDETPELLPWSIVEVHKRAREYFKQYKGDGKVQITVEDKKVIKEVSKLQHRDFELGGFEADTGLTGRKTQVDTYCGLIRHGGGAFAGKDPSKVDKSGALWARFLARQVVKEFKGECMVRLSFEIGNPYPVEVWSDRSEFSKIYSNFEMSVPEFIEKLELRKPIWKDLACYGYFGRKGYKWEE